MTGQAGNYLGRKGQAGTWQVILNHMPPHRVFIDLFCGTGLISAKKEQAEISWVNDIDRDQVLKACDFVISEGKTRPKFRSLDAIQCLREIDLKEGDCNFNRQYFIYCDPPYLLATRTSRQRYQYEYSTDQHTDLLGYLKRLDANIMISGYPNDLYHVMLENEGWKAVEFQSMTRGGIRTEKLWMNYELESVIDTRFVGKNCMERQQIKRKAERWQEKYKKMPIYEQQAILQALMEVHRV